jgi:ADP-dependent NAD(P)H-hydrate dehydratase
MINSHQFQQAAKQFRAGRISLSEFTDLVMAETPSGEPGAPTPPTDAPDVRSENATKGQVELPSGLPKRKAESHKGDFGRVVAIGGSAAMAGAISLTGLAALRSGSGLVRVVVPEVIQQTVASFSPCLMTVGTSAKKGCFHREAHEGLVEEANWADVVAIGPGMGRAKALQSIMHDLYSKVHQPMVVDADGLNVLVDAKVDLSQHEGQRILTPHPGEFQRLAGTKITNRAELERSAKQLAETANVIVVLKGNRTYVTDGSHEYRNATGNPGMATAGSGDVLTGVITSLVGQGLSPMDAATLGVHVHSTAGDFAAEAVGETSLIATDIIEHLPNAFKKHAHGSVSQIGFQS